ncbi:MAG: cytidine deaminase [Prevotella sp.]|nr:cytidine deaminase [Prevotella sp.]MCM1074876.1 cytidine deaminase [Ruminococcus sp.]
MKQLNITVPVQVCSFEALAETDRELVTAAKDATTGSYAPYSNFHVGAAIRLDDGTIITGANQENAAFSSGTCAERSACFAAGANYPRKTMVTIAIAACNDEGFQRKPISPCGACRQVLLEYEHKQGSPMRVILYGSDECYILPSIASLLPLCFTEF